MTDWKAICQKAAKFQSQSALEGAVRILQYGVQQKYALHEIAYALATAGHESAWTYAPITEYGGVRYFDKYDVGRLAEQLGNTPEKDGDGYKYRGRGYVQITGFANYLKFQKLTGKPLTAKPDLALEHSTAAYILYYGIVNGSFTGKRLSDYVNANSVSSLGYKRARAVVNGDVAKNGKSIGDAAFKWYLTLLEHKQELAQKPSILGSLANLWKGTR